MNLCRAYRRLRYLLCKDYAGYAKEFVETSSQIRSKVVELLGAAENVRMLDIGCGESYLATILFTAWGWDVTGIDIDPVWRVSPMQTLMAASKGGPRGIAKRAMHEFGIARRLQAGLLKAAGVKMPRHLDIRNMSATNMAFEEGEFDFVYSNAVMEHVFGIDEAISEIARVMRPGAVGRHSIFPFASITGGHDFEMVNFEKGLPAGAKPWNHLISGKSPSIEYLNKCRERDYRQAFERHFDILRWDKVQKGEQYLTPEIKEVLSAYDEDDLLTTDIEVLVRKPV